MMAPPWPDKLPIGPPKRLCRHTRELRRQHGHLPCLDLEHRIEPFGQSALEYPWLAQWDTTRVARESSRSDWTSSK